MPQTHRELQNITLGRYRGQLTAQACPSGTPVDAHGAPALLPEISNALNSAYGGTRLAEARWQRSNSNYGFNHSAARCCIKILRSAVPSQRSRKVVLRGRPAKIGRIASLAGIF